jgi:hypothetical protein
MDLEVDRHGERIRAVIGARDTVANERAVADDR